MAIDMKEMLHGVRFKAYGTLSDYNTFERDSEAVYQYTIDYIGGSVKIEVDQSEFVNPPELGTPFEISGIVKYSSYNGSIRFMAEEKKQLKELKAEDYVKGIQVFGVGVVETKKASVMNRKQFFKIGIKFTGGLHLFNDFPVELFQRCPNKGELVAFSLGVTTMTNRQDGVQSQAYVPTLSDVSGEKLFSPPELESQTATPASRQTGYPSPGATAATPDSSTRARRGE